MKTLLSVIAAVGLFALTGYSQAPSTIQPVIPKIGPPVLVTNSTGPVLEGPFIDFLGSLSTATNWGVAAFSIYAPQDKSWGAGLVALYNISPYVATGIGIDWLDRGNVTMPSTQVQFQAPFLIGGKVRVTPFGFTGVATPLSGKGDDNKTVVGLFGAGLGVKIYGGLQAFYAIEQRTGESGVWNLFGLAFSRAF